MSNRALTLMMGLVAFLIVIVGAVFVVVIATSGGDDDDNVPANGGSDPENTPSSSRSGDICEGDTLFTFGADPASLLDPIQVRDEGTSEYIVEIFGGLVTLDTDLNIQPDIAESWEVSPDGLTYTFSLRDNVVFHNGTRVTAEDFKYSIERAADPRNNSPTVMLYLADIVGVQEKFRESATEVSGVRVIDERTLEIEIKEPIEFFLAELTYPVAYVVDQDQIERDPRNWTRQPNGTGPFRLAEFQPAELIRLVKNDRYHLGAPLLDEVVFELAGGSIVTRYQNNDLHIGLVPGIEIEAVKSGSSPVSADYKPRSRMAVSYLAFNLKQPPFDDINVRKALALSVDRETINTVLLYDTQRIADGILPPEMPGYTESVRGYTYDVEEARRLIEESTYADNMPRIILTYPGTGGDSPDTLQAIQAGWQENLGIEVELQASEYSAFLRELRNGTFQMFGTGWAADYPDPEDFLDKLFNTESAQNEQGYSNPEVDAILAEARVEPDTERRYELYAEAEQMILDDYAIIPTYWPTEHLLVKPCVHNWPENLSMTVPFYRLLEIRED